MKSKNLDINWLSKFQTMHEFMVNSGIVLPFIFTGNNFCPVLCSPAQSPCLVFSLVLLCPSFRCSSEGLEALWPFPLPSAGVHFSAGRSLKPRECGYERLRLEPKWCCLCGFCSRSTSTNSWPSPYTLQPQYVYMALRRNRFSILNRSLKLSVQ